VAARAKTKKKQQFTGAAFFDLDRTLLAGASGPVYSEALREVGVLTGEAHPVESVLFKLFDLVGENYPTMVLTKQGVRLVKGWDVATVDRAAALAAPRLYERVLPYAHVELAEHRANGRAVVLATTTPYHLVKPLADLLGFDDVIATRYGTSEDGASFDGTVDGEYVWGKGKSRSVALWALEHHVDLADCHAYSDSYYDVPMLSIVGNPHVVNPDPRMIAMAALRRWPSRSFSTPEGVPRFAGLEPQQLVMMFARSELLPFVRFRTYGKKRIPLDGPAIIVGNHRSYFDPLAIGYLLAQRGRPVRFLGKKEVFDAPVVGDFAKAMGGIRVERGTGSDAPLQAALESLAAGDMVAMMPQGTIPRGRAFFEPVLKGRWGAARLAHESRVPVIPIGIWGTEKVWPRSSKVPNLANVTHPPTVTIRVGPPVELEYDSVEADTERIMAAIMRLLPPSSRSEYEPTEEEIRLASPGGVIPEDATPEDERRPGID
jgi:putative phosphoserine phosphatase/1-acylglycerol-3-phosphate O-acyltransferase